MPNKPKIIVVLGPTASGKSDLAVDLARQFNGEIISADSRQVYRGMDIGSGKITKKEMKGVPHYLLDVADPKRRFSAGQFKKLGEAAIQKILIKNKLPIICGGTGFYIQALVDNISLPEVKPDLKLRAQLEKLTTRELFEKLKKLDPSRAQKIDANNRRRLIRAIEIAWLTKKPVAPLKAQPEFEDLKIGVKKSSEELEELIRRRLLKRLKKGMIKEVENLRQSGVSWKRLESLGLEYRWIARYLQNKISYKEMAIRLQKDIEHFAKRQMTWFKRDQQIKWITKYGEAEKLTKNFLKK